MPGTKPVELGSLKVGQYIVIDEVPCRIVDMTKSKPGKHGGAKIRLTAMGLFENVKKEHVGPTSSRADVPLIDKRKGQVLSIMGDLVQIMDLETFDTLEIPMPEDVEEIDSGMEVEYFEAVGRYKITRVISK
ncbi:translation initiation factor IF-5A [Methanococcus aeolicus]|uniref:Translation initiation factor 5A n=1 Tax=Methanococcus aeolicus (strain ATCC BAA-1280 / DSM 17508 / OCM 812 / Nankai-3) TaxID=419665 RepID=IF5A_META3|nr:translation initiation factor IF-5A [Methanococcus aeolicus]A6UVH4.1 RecName: Full=Translation initiation factor 5A; AltName: Full=Hypusine-containing protein; AltName: Full=eIF-5A [Methanococcus aeolicus Nankai-3]ABR56496.1 translation initiation factor eIF-5A [Methanococcus aeolicus Nankai-3]UXM84498.1 translation initiation factor IF-5A [Methanococcus aeolicus]